MNRFEKLRDLLNSQGCRDLDAQNDIMEMFPQASKWTEVAAEVRKLVRERDRLSDKLQQQAPNLDDYVLQAATAVESGHRLTETIDRLRTFKKAQLQQIARQLGFELEGRVGEIRAAMKRWLESHGEERPISKTELLTRNEEEIRSMLSGKVNDLNAATLIAKIKEAHSVTNARQFEQFAARLGLPTAKGKDKTLGAIINFVDNQSVLSVQTG